MKKLLFFTALITLSVGLKSQTSGGPDAYGYTWKNSNNTTNPPTYNWVDIASRGTLVTGLSDDNVIGPFNLAFSFHFYWYNVSKFWVGSNGYISFTGDNIASPFPTSIPCNTGSSCAANNWIAPLMGDLIFTGTGNTAKCYYYTNSDSLIVSYIDVPFWISTSPSYTGGNSFQIILSRLDSSITFNYLKTDIGSLTATDDAVGIENVIGNLGLPVHIDVLPADTMSVKFYYPQNVTYQAIDAGMNWNNNSKNGGVFIKNTVTNYPLKANVMNFGNQNIGSILVRDTVFNSSNTSITTGSKQISSLPVNSDTSFYFSNVFNARTSGPGIYRLNTGFSGITNELISSNNYLSQEMVVIDTSLSTITLEYSDGLSNGGLGWNGGGGGVAIYYEPPFYPVKIVSTRFYISANAATPVGFSAQIYDDDGPNGTKGSLLDSVWVPPSAITTGAYKTVGVSKSNLYITSGGVYVFWNMGGAGINIGKDLTPPFSRRTYEVLFNAWAEYRAIQTEDFLIGLTIEPTWPLANIQADSSNDPKIVFTDKSTRNPTSWLWDFGDSSSTDTNQNTFHTYTANGKYKVCLTATNSAGSNKVCKYQTVNKVPPVADFIADTTADPKIVFTDKSTNKPTSWLWNFGEKGATSTLQNPTYTFKFNGNHNVCLVAKNGGGTDTVCKVINIKKCSPIMGFTADTILDPTISFTDTSANSPTTWEWNFGDLATSTQKNPTHTYTANGKYAVCLKVTNAYGSDYSCKYINVWMNPPKANFTADTTLDPKFTFTDVSTNSPKSRMWYLGESGATSTLQKPSYTYTIPGEHLVCLRVTNLGGSDSVCKKIAVRKLTPIAGFTFDTVSDPTIYFTDSTIGYPASWLWTFNDKGATSTLKNPVHTFSANGTYNVCLKVTNPKGNTTKCKDVIIRKVKPTADFTFISTNDPEISFTDASINNPASWHWDFDDNGATSSDQNPKYTFTKNGDFNVCLIASNAGGSDTTCKKVSVVKIPPVAAFSSDNTSDPSISFTDNSTNIPLSWFWDFGDKTTSTKQNPNHSYLHNGNYQVCLKVTNAGGSDSVCNSVAVSKVIPVAGFTHDSLSMPVINFSDASTEYPTKWSWHFDDSGNDSSDVQNPSYTFKANGKHRVCLVASNAGGSSTPYCKDIFISGIGINDHGMHGTLLVYPNPFSESTIIEMKSDKLYTGLKLKCYNSLGQDVNVKYNVNKNKIELFREKMAQGYYYIEIFDQKTPLGRGVIIVQ